MKHSALVYGVFIMLAVMSVGGLAVFVQHWDPFPVGERVVISDQLEVVERLKRNTPVRFELIDSRWGTATIDEPQKLYSIWSILESLEPAQQQLAEYDHIEGRIYFFDGSVRQFSISNRFQMDSFILGNRDQEMDVQNLYQILLYTLQTKENLIDLVQRSESIYALPGGAFFHETNEERIELDEQDLRSLIDRISQSERILQSSELTQFLQIYGYHPIYHLIVVSNRDGSETFLVISVLSYSYFSVSDLSYSHRNVMFFQGNLLQLVEDIFLRK